MLPARMSGRAIAAAATVVALLQQPAEVAEMPVDVATCGTDNCWQAKIVGMVCVWPPRRLKASVPTRGEGSSL